MIISNLDSIDGSLSTLSVSVEDIEQHINHLNTQNEHLRELIVTIKNIGEDAKTVLPSIARHVESSTTELVSASNLAKEQIKEAGNNLNSTVENIAKQMQNLTDAHAKQTTENMEQIQKHLQEVLETSLSSLGGQLASLSEKFVRDYLPLTNQLREVVRIAEGVKYVNRQHLNP